MQNVFSFFCTRDSSDFQVVAELLWFTLTGGQEYLYLRGPESEAFSLSLNKEEMLYD